VEECEVLVIGAGAMGSSVAWWLTRWTRNVVVLEQFRPGHDRGSSHGSTRIFRLAYPDPVYIGMARESLTLWRELEADAGVELLVTTGGIDCGDPASVGLNADAMRHAAVPHEVVDPGEAASRWPGFTFDRPVLYQPDAGRVWAHATVSALQERARSRGARLHFDEPVQMLSPVDDDRVVVTTDAEQYRARCAVVTAGPWVTSLLGGIIELPRLTVTREQVFHFQSHVGTTWPSFIHHAGTFVYGLQSPGQEGVKVAEHHTGAVTTAEARSFEIDEAGRARVIDHVTRWMPGLDPSPTSASTCLYTNTPDESFVLERHGPIVVGSACSGHGFKFVPLIGRRLAELAVAE
jgi:sarcosine oxidase